MESTQVAVKENVAIAPPQEQITHIEGLDFSDVQPTRYNLAQKMSKSVDEKKAQPGQIIDSITGAVVADDEGKAIELIPLSVYKEWAHYYTDVKPAKFFARTPFSSENAAWEYEGMSGDTPPRPTMNQICMIWSMLPVGGSMPVLVSFKSKSYRAGKTLASLVMQNSMAKKTTTVKLSSEKQTNDKGTFHVFKIQPGRELTDAEIESSNAWKKMISKKPIVVEPESADEAVPF